MIFVPHKGEKSVVIHENGTEHSSSCFASQRSLTKMVERVPQDVRVPRSGTTYGVGVKIQTLVRL